MTTDDIPRDLGDGLVLRRATAGDAEKLIEFNANIHQEEGEDGPNEYVDAWVRDLATKPHPTFQVDDFTLVEDTGEGNKIVSSLNLIPQTWSYGGVEFGVGRPELVGTDPEYRRRGLIRAQFEVIHRWSEARGHMIQAITGIPYYYRQFGYEMGLGLGGGRVGYMTHIPKLKEDEEEPYTIRPASEADIPFLNATYLQGCERYAVNCVWDEALWRYELAGKSEKSANRSEIRVIEKSGGGPVGYLTHSIMLWGPTLGIQQYELKPGVSWLAVTPSVLRYIKSTGEAYAAEADDKEMQAFVFWMGTEHPVYQAIDDRLPRKRDPYAWYVRVPDLPGFLQHVAPTLERRLADSILIGHTGELKLNFFRSGVKIDFEDGKLKEVEAYTPEQPEDGDASFPDLTFLQVLFGYHSAEELEYAYADCYPRNDHGRALVSILFPKGAANLWPVS
jgi:GNAT superfamily N-acetyltransferase